MQAQLATAEATVAAAGAGASEREQSTLALLSQTSTELQAAHAAAAAAVADAKAADERARATEMKAGTAAAVLQRLLPAVRTLTLTLRARVRCSKTAFECTRFEPRMHYDNGYARLDSILPQPFCVPQAAAVERLADVPLVDMARDVVTAVEAAQRHSATLQEQSTQLAARSAAAEEAAASLRTQLAAAQSELAEARVRAGSLQEQVTTHGASNGAALEAMGATHAAEVATLKEQLTTKTQEARELSHMLRAWEAMRAGKDQQIAQLVELSRRFEEESHQKTRHMQALRQRASTFASPDSGTSSALTGGASPPLSLTTRRHRARQSPTKADGERGPMRIYERWWEGTAPVPQGMRC